jgi:hypothetical protein
MIPTAQQDNALLLRTAKAVAAELKQRTEGTSLRIRTPAKVVPTNTRGWSAVLGDLGPNQPRLEIWLDRFAGYDQRKFNICFFSTKRSVIRHLAKRVAKSRRRRHRVITEDDIAKTDFFFMPKRLKRAEFGQPFLEEYDGYEAFFYGVYDLTVRSQGGAINPPLCVRAAEFFESVARTLPNARPSIVERLVYPHREDRKVVAAHLAHDRSKRLAKEAKIRDDYQCQVCRMRFEKIYGDLGKGFAEAHHLLPLSRSAEKVETRLEDLATVCSNCHHMLHRLEGKRGDINRLKRIFRSNR